MNCIGRVLIASLAGLCWSAMAFAQDTVLEDFAEPAQDRWEYIADTVMGGVSDGGAVIGLIDGSPAVRLTGDVSTQNNGGFIQVRRMLPDGLPPEMIGFELDVRGNDQAYYVFVRTSEMTRPWYIYQVTFQAETNWQKVRIPLDTFARSHAHLSETIDPAKITSIGLAAYGRDHKADLMVREIKLF